MRIRPPTEGRWERTGLYRIWKTDGEPAPTPSIATRIASAFKGQAAKPNTPLAKLIAEGAAVKTELAAMESTEGRRLSGKAFAEEAVKMPGADKAERDLVLKVIEQPENEALASALRGLVRRMIEPGVSRPWPKIRAHFLQDADNVLARLRVTQASAFAAAAIFAARDYPEKFGKVANSKQWDAHLAEKIAKIAEIKRRIGAEWQRSDVDIAPQTGDDKAKGLVRLTLDCTGGAVCVGEDMGEHAVNWWLTNCPSTARAA